MTCSFHNFMNLMTGVEVNHESVWSTPRNKSQTGHLEGGAAMTSLIAAVFQVSGLGALLCSCAKRSSKESV